MRSSPEQIMQIAQDHASRATAAPTEKEASRLWTMHDRLMTAYRKTAGWSYETGDERAESEEMFLGKDSALTPADLCIRVGIDPQRNKLDRRLAWFGAGDFYTMTAEIEE